MRVGAVLMAVAAGLSLTSCAAKTRGFAVVAKTAPATFSVLVDPCGSTVRNLELDLESAASTLREVEQYEFPGGLPALSAMLAGIASDQSVPADTRYVLRGGGSEDGTPLYQLPFSRRDLQNLAEQNALVPASFTDKPQQADPGTLKTASVTNSLCEKIIND